MTITTWRGTFILKIKTESVKPRTKMPSSSLLQ